MDGFHSLAEINVLFIAGPFLNRFALTEMTG